MQLWQTSVVLWSIGTTQFLQCQVLGALQNETTEASLASLSRSSFGPVSDDGEFPGISTGVELLNLSGSSSNEGVATALAEEAEASQSTGREETSDQTASHLFANCTVGDTGVSKVDSQSSPRSQGIQQHQAVDSEGKTAGPTSPIENVESATIATSHGDIVLTWNPIINPGATEEEGLKHQDPPKDFVELPLLDSQAEEQSELAEVSRSISSYGIQSSSEGSFATPERGSRRRSDVKYPSGSTLTPGRSEAPLSGGSSDRITGSWYRGIYESGTPASGRYRSRYESRTPLSGSYRNRYESSTPIFGRYRSRFDSGGEDLSNPSGGYSSRNQGSPSSPESGGGRDRSRWSGGLPPLDSGYARSPVKSRFYDSPVPPTTTPESPASSASPAPTPDRSLPEPVLGRGWLPNRTIMRSRGSEDTFARKTQCTYRIGGVSVDASYLDSACTGVIQVEYRFKAAKFHQRRLLLQNKTGEPVTVVLKTVNARSPAQSADAKSTSVLQEIEGPAVFLQQASKEESAQAIENYVQEMLKQMRRHRRKEPDSPIDLVVSFTSPLDNPEDASKAVSFMQTQDGAARIMQLCEELFSVLGNKEHYGCEALEALDMVILRFPPKADFSEEGVVHKVLERLLELEGRNIHFWEISRATSLQMAPVDQDLPEPPMSLMKKPVLLQAKEEMKQQCSDEATTRSYLLGGDSPVASRIPQDADLESKLWGLYSSRCVHAWMHGEKGHRNVVVAVVDSGVADHSELDANIWRNPKEALDGQDNDGNGFVDDVVGWNFASNTNVIEDMNGHGTHVGGIIGGVANNQAIVGCAPLVSLMKVQQFGESGKGSIGDAVRGVAYALMQGVHIINNSWGSCDSTRSLEVAISRSQYVRGGLGVLVVNAAGNSSSNNDIYPFYPAAYDQKNTISVGAYNADGQLASFSNYGKSSVTLLAPGDRIYSTYLKNDYSFLSGTSMAAPHVSGVAALVFGVFTKANSEVSAAEVKDIIRATLQALPAAQEKTKWGGAPDAMAAVLMARMGGMWCQMKCTDMIVDLKPKESYAPTVYIRGYEKGLYIAEIQVEVYDKAGQLLGTQRIPFQLNSSISPQANTPSDSVAASAFSSYAQERDHSNPLCDVQLKYTGTLEAEDEWSALRIAAVVLGCVSALLLLFIGGFAFYLYRKKQKALRETRASRDKQKVKEQEGDAHESLLREDLVANVDDAVSESGDPKEE